MGTAAKSASLGARVDSSLLERDPIVIKRRNRRIAYIIVAFLVTMTLLCAAYIKWWGGANMGPMAPYHSQLHMSIDRSPL